MYSGTSAHRKRLGQSAAGTRIVNQASTSYTDPTGNPVTVQSNPVEIVTVATRTLATLTFNRITASGSCMPVGPTACAQNAGPFVTLPDPVLLGGASIDPSQPQNLEPSDLYHAGEPLFVTLSDLDQNLDPGVRETIDVTIESVPPGDTETLRLTETGIDSGLFAGYIQTAEGSATPGDCLLQVVDDSNVSGFYQDPNDAVDSDDAQAIVDPTNIVFDAGTGNPVDGATIRLVDAVTGAPAIVYGADGTSSFPASITSGGSVSDASGQVYDFPPGGYRFPVVPEGEYRIEIDPPTGYLGLSQLSIGVLQGLPGAPYALDTGSFGATFAVDNTLAINLDLPLDPEESVLYLQKTTGVTVAGPGDFVPYTLRIENTGVLVQTRVTIADVLPVGFRLVPGSTYINDTAAAEPVVAADGRSLSFDLGDLDPGASISIRYVTEVTVGASGKTATNIATANSPSGVQSNEASAVLQLVEELFTSKSTIAGRVILDSCDAEVSNDLEGVGGLRVYMEDGRYAITDEGGRFHFEGLEPGTHVVQLDTDTLPSHLEVNDCQENSRFAGRDYSQFVNLRAGGLWRADFHLRTRPLPTGTVTLELDGEPANANTVRYELNVGGGGVPVDDVIVNVVLPEGLAYVARSSIIGTARDREPEQRDNILSYRLGDKPQEWSEKILLDARLTSDANDELSTNAVATFRTPDGNTGRTPLANKRFDYRQAQNEARAISFSPRFATLSAAAYRSRPARTGYPDCRLAGR